MEEKTLETLAGEIASSGTVCRLKGTYRLDLAAAKTVVCGEERFGCLLALSRPGLVVDGREAVLYAEADAPFSEDVSLIFLTPQAKFASLRHLDIRFTYKQEPRSFAVRAVDCRAYGVSFEDCRVSMCAESRVNLIGLMLKACRDTPLETNADCCRLSRSRIDVRCFAEDDTRPSAVYGIVNRWANSFAAEDNFIFAATRGRGAEHRAVGVFNAGRFARIVNNNIKANGQHPAGKWTDQPHVVGVHNEGEYLVMNANQCVGEWGGACIGLLNTGSFAAVSGNKILSTHTINGKTIVNSGNWSVINGNAVLSTGRNYRLIVNDSSDTVISNNNLRGTLFYAEHRSGCGIRMEHCCGCILSGNRIGGVKDCGVFSLNSTFESYGNYAESPEFPSFVPTADETDRSVAAALEEALIRSAED